jgi:hypothetical protein
MKIYDDENRCHFKVWEMWSGHRCYRKNGYGPGEGYCKQHANKIKERTDRHAEWNRRADSGKGE